MKVKQVDYDTYLMQMTYDEYQYIQNLQKVNKQYKQQIEKMKSPNSDVKKALVKFRNVLDVLINKL